MDQQQKKRMIEKFSVAGSNARERKLEESILVLTKELENDSDYRNGWIANIAMSYKDCENWYKKKTGKKQLNTEDKHIIANKAAENFISLLCNKHSYFSCDF